MRGLAWSVLLAVEILRPAEGHIVPIPPSLCAFDPIHLDVPVMGLAGDAQAAVSADTMRILYDVASNDIQICSDPADRCNGVVPRAFTLGPSSGTLTLPPFFFGRMQSSGDVTVDDVPLVLTLDGTPTTARVSLTTGLTAVNGTVLEGAPLQGFSSIVLVGLVEGDALPAPFTGRSLVLTMSCQPRPVPDIAQFAPAPEMTGIAGQITGSTVRLRATVEVFPPSPPPNFGGGPTLFAVHLDGKTIASAIIPTGLSGRRHLMGTSVDGSAVVEVRERSASRFVIDLSARNLAIPPQQPNAPVLVSLTVDGGGILGRGEKLFNASRNGRRLRPASSLASTASTGPV